MLRRRTLTHIAMTGGLSLALRTASSATAEIRVVSSGSDEGTKRILDVVERRLPSAVTGTDIRTLTQRRGTAVYLPLGPAALQATLDSEVSGASILSLFVSAEAYSRTLGALQRRARSQCTAIFAEASPASQMQLIRALFARRVSVGVLLSDATSRQEAMIRRAAGSAGLDVDIQLVESGENVLRALTRVSSAAVLLTLPDPELYTPETLRGILESTYRRNQPVIGFSASLVSAGTLAAAYSSIDDTIAHAAEVITSMAGGRIPDAQHPLYWRVAVNQNVARSLNVVVGDAVRTLGNFPP